MLIYILKRLLLSLLVVAVVSVLAFSLVYISGDPAAAIAGQNATPQDITRIRSIYGFDRPLYVQYFDWVDRAVHGDLGTSYFLHQPITEVLARHFPVTAKLALCAIAFALLLAVPLGVFAALRPNTIVDQMALGTAVAGQVIPSFLVGLGLIYIFGVMLRWLPIAGASTWMHYIMPAVTLGYYATPMMMRLTRSTMIDALQSDHVRTANAYGLTAWRVIFKHALRNAIMPILSLSAVELGAMLGGSVVTESVFSMKGIGYLAWVSIQRSDIGVIQGILLLVATLYAAVVLLADVLNAFLDPRLRNQ